jgi:hypothetical protein
MDFVTVTLCNHYEWIFFFKKEKTSHCPFSLKSYNYTQYTHTSNLNFFLLNTQDYNRKITIDFFFF